MKKEFESNLISVLCFLKWFFSGFRRFKDIIVLLSKLLKRWSDYAIHRSRNIDHQLSTSSEENGDDKYNTYCLFLTWPLGQLDVVCNVTQLCHASLDFCCSLGSVSSLKYSSVSKTVHFFRGSLKTLKEASRLYWVSAVNLGHEGKRSELSPSWPGINQLTFLLCPYPHGPHSVWRHHRRDTCLVEKWQPLKGIKVTFLSVPLT